MTRDFGLKYGRKSMRLPAYDYTSSGYYFVTICTRDHQCLFGDVVDGKICSNYIGEMINWHWNRIPLHFSNVELDKFTVMPNHLHGIVILVGAKHFNKESIVASNNSKKNASPLRPIGTTPKSLSSITQNFKTITSRKYNRMKNTKARKLWQRSFYDRIIRNEKELYNIRKYIINNPLKWALDSENPQNLESWK